MHNLFKAGLVARRGLRGNCAAGSPLKHAAGSPLKHTFMTLSALCLFLFSNITMTSCTKQTARSSTPISKASQLNVKSNGFGATTPGASTKTTGAETPAAGSTFDTGVAEGGSHYADNDPRRNTTMVVSESGEIAVTYGPELEKAAMNNPKVADVLNPEKSGNLSLTDVDPEVNSALDATIHTLPFNINELLQAQPYKLKKKAPEDKAKLAFFILDNQKKLKYILQKEADTNNWESLKEAKNIADSVDIFCLQEVVDSSNNKILQLVLFNEIGPRSINLVDDATMQFSSIVDLPTDPDNPDSFGMPKINRCLAASGKLQRKSGLAALSSRQKDIDLQKASQEQANLGLYDQHEWCSIIVTSLIYAVVAYFLLTRIFQMAAKKALMIGLAAAGITFIIPATGGFDVFGKLLWINKIAGGICKLFKDGCLLGDFCLFGGETIDVGIPKLPPVTPSIRREDEPTKSMERDVEQYNN